MLAGPPPRVFTFLSATSPAEKSAMLVNLGASLARGGNVVLLDACPPERGVAGCISAVPHATLLEVARQQCALNQAVLAVRQGFRLVSLAGSAAWAAADADEMRRLANTFHVLAAQADVLLVDAELDARDGFPLAAMAAGDVVVQVAPDAHSVKAAYALIKRLSAVSGRRSFGVLVTGAGEQEAATVYRNMAQAARRYLALPLYSIGFIPPDEHVGRAARLGRSVVDAFPRAGASVAFRRLAEQVSLRIAGGESGMPARYAEAGA